MDVQLFDIFQNMWTGITTAFCCTIEFIKACFQVDTLFGIIVLVGIIFGGKRRSN